MGHELRHACRTLLRVRSLPAAAIPSLALGVGASAAVFLEPLPYPDPVPDPDRIVQVWQLGSFVTRTGAPDFALVGRLARNRSRSGQAEYLTVSAGYFPAMQIPPGRGRLFDERDTEAPHVAVTSDGPALRRDKRSGGEARWKTC